ncbi:MAG: hypothetical protein KBT01_06035, partial [Clostridiales bacterium]|nr:hypothetical protein [Candidatus Blautia equi]
MKYITAAAEDVSASVVIALNESEQIAAISGGKLKVNGGTDVHAEMNRDKTADGAAPVLASLTLSGKNVVGGSVSVAEAIGKSYTSAQVNAKDLNTGSLAVTNNGDASVATRIENTKDGFIGASAVIANAISKDRLNAKVEVEKDAELTTRQLTVKTDYTAKADAYAQTSGGGVKIKAVDIAFNSAKAAADTTASAYVKNAGVIHGLDNVSQEEMDAIQEKYDEYLEKKAVFDEKEQRLAKVQATIKLLKEQLNQMGNVGGSAAEDIKKAKQELANKLTNYNKEEKELKAWLTAHNRPGLWAYNELVDAAAQKRAQGVAVTVNGDVTANAKIAAPSVFKASTLDLIGNFAEAAVSTNQTARLENENIMDLELGISVKDTYINQKADSAIEDGAGKGGVKVSLASGALNRSKSTVEGSAIAEIKGNGKDSIKAVSAEVIAESTGTRSDASLIQKNANVGLVSGGSTKVEAISEEKVKADITNTKITTEKDVRVSANANTNVNATGASPAKVQGLDVYAADVNAKIGSQKVQALIGEGTSIEAKGNVDIQAKNEGSVVSQLKNNTEVSLVNIKSGSLDATSKYNTLLGLDKNASVKANAVTMNAVDNEKAQSVSGGGSSWSGINVGSISGKTEAVSDVRFLVGENAKVNAESFKISNDNAADLTTSTTSDSKSLFDGGDVYTTSKLERNVKADIEKKASIVAEKALSIDVTAGKNDKLSTRVYVDAMDLGGSKTAQAATTVKNTSNINIYEGANLEASSLENAGFSLHAATGLGSLKSHSEIEQKSGAGTADARVKDSLTLKSGINLMGTTNAAGNPDPEKLITLLGYSPSIKAELGAVNYDAYAESDQDGLKATANAFIDTKADISSTISIEGADLAWRSDSSDAVLRASVEKSGNMNFKTDADADGLYGHANSVGTLSGSALPYISIRNSAVSSKDKLKTEIVRFDKWKITGKAVKDGALLGSDKREWNNNLKVDDSKNPDVNVNHSTRPVPTPTPEPAPAPDLSKETMASLISKYNALDPKDIAGQVKLAQEILSRSNELADFNELGTKDVRGGAFYYDDKFYSDYMVPEKGSSKDVYKIRNYMEQTGKNPAQKILLDLMKEDRFATRNFAMGGLFGKNKKPKLPAKVTLDLTKYLGIGGAIDVMELGVGEEYPLILLSVVNDTFTWQPINVNDKLQIDIFIDTENGWDKDGNGNGNNGYAGYVILTMDEFTEFKEAHPDKEFRLSISKLLNK